MVPSDHYLALVHRMPELGPYAVRLYEPGWNLAYAADYQILFVGRSSEESEQEFFDRVNERGEAMLQPNARHGRVVCDELHSILQPPFPISYDSSY